MTTTEHDVTIDELDVLDFQLIPNQEPAHPKAIEWIQKARDASDSHGVLPVSGGQEQYDRLRNHLRKAAETHEVTVTIKPVLDSKGKITGLTFTVGARRGRKTS